MLPAARKPQASAGLGAHTSSGGCGVRVCDTEGAGRQALYCAKPLPWLEGPTAHLSNTAVVSTTQPELGSNPPLPDSSSEPSPQPGLCSALCGSIFEQPQPQEGCRQPGIPSTGPSGGSAGEVSGKRESEVNPWLQELPSVVTGHGTAPALIPMPASPCEQDGPGGAESSLAAHTSAGRHTRAMPSAGLGRHRGLWLTNPGKSESWG